MYTTADLDLIIAKLEGCLSVGYAEVTFEGRQLRYSTTTEILNRIAYFRALYDEAADAPVAYKRKIRTLLMYGGNGIS